MNVASRELCERLCELSGWRDVDYSYFEHGVEHTAEIISHSLSPAYDLGYLLRKLPGYLRLEHATDNGKFEWFFYHREDLITVATTPEDAAAKLCIALFEQGVLS